MNREELINALYEAGVIPPGYGGTENQFLAFHRFAEIVAAIEREICAEICDHEMDSAIKPAMQIAAGNCADKIRARREQ